MHLILLTHKVAGMKHAGFALEKKRKSIKRQALKDLKCGKRTFKI